MAVVVDRRGRELKLYRSLKSFHYDRLNEDTVAVDIGVDLMMMAREYSCCCYCYPLLEEKGVSPSMTHHHMHRNIVALRASRDWLPRTPRRVPDDVVVVVVVDN